MPESRQKSVNPTRGMGITAESALITIATRSRHVPMNGNHRIEQLTAHATTSNRLVVRRSTIASR